MSALLLAAVGDAVGFRGGQWEFMVDGAALRAACRDEFGSAAAVVPAPAAGWPVSDDTCLSMSVARALLADDDPTVADFAGHFWADQAVWADPDRAPGGACLRFLAVFRTVPFAPPGFSALGGGCGAATRALPVGLAVPGVGARLVDLAVSSALPTHWHPGGVLAAVLVAWCAALARSAVHPEEWFRDFTAYMDQGGAAAVTERLVAALAAEATVTAECDRFLTAVRRYCRERLVGPCGAPVWPPAFDRDAWMRDRATNSWPGSSGVDCCVIAYDALLWACAREPTDADARWALLLETAALHGGDSDSVATVACGWFGALAGPNVPAAARAQAVAVEFADELADLERRLAAVRAR